MLRAQRKKSPQHELVTRTYLFALQVQENESRQLFKTLDQCWEARELLVRARELDRIQQRTLREAGAATGYLTRADQYRYLSYLQSSNPTFATLHSQVLQNVAVRVDEGTKRWLEALKAGRTHVRPPGPIERKHYRSFTYPQYGSSAKIKGGRLHLSKLGSFRVHDYRKMRGTPKTATVVFKHGRWWVAVTCEIQAREVCRPLEAVAHLPDTGIDPGLEALAVTAQGERFDPPKALKEALGKLRHAQRNMSRKFEVRKRLHTIEKAAGTGTLAPLRAVPYSGRLSAQIRRVAKLHTKIERVRSHHHKQIARRIERSHRGVAVEEHAVQFMLANRRTARAAADRAIHAFKGHLRSAVGEARYVAAPNRRPGIGGNSQTCLCGAAVPKTLKERTHRCPACGLTAPRDQVSANIVMGCAFGTTHLQPGAGHAFVRRGGTQVVGASAPSHECESTSEAPLKRQLFTTPSERHNTADAQATAIVKNTRHRRRRASLPVATQPLAV